MSEFKYACPVCGQHMMCDSSQGGSVMECPTCFQKITAPQAPTSTDAKFILTGTKVSEKRISSRGFDAATGPAVTKRNFPASILIGMIVLVLAAGAGIFFYGGKLLQLVSPWQASDIGNVGAPGSSSRANGVFTINGSGADIWRQADGFYYLFQPLNGDGALTAHVLNLKNTDLWAKAGVMIRETTEASSMTAVTAIRPDGQAQFIWRNATGAEAASSELAGGMGFPKWVKIVRTGDLFSAFYKVNAGDAWKLINAPQTIHMSPSTQIGLIVCAHNAGTLCQAQFDQVTFQTDKKAGQK